MKNRLTWRVYRISCRLARLFCPKPTFEGLENLPDGPCVIVGNHAQMNGPIIAELDLPGERAIWCSAEMMHLREVPDYAFRDFWSKKPRAVRWCYRLLSYIIAPLSVCIFNNAHCIGVYRDGRVMATLRETLERLRGGARIVIFPEHDVPHNGIVWAFQEGFLVLARMYARQTGMPLRFVPMYVAPRLKTVFFGEPVRFRADAPIKDERERICRETAERITAMAAAQPVHTVVPYRNIRKKDYPKNIPVEVYPE